MEPVADAGIAQGAAGAVAPVFYGEIFLLYLTVDKGVLEILPLIWFDNTPVLAGQAPETL